MTKNNETLQVIICLKVKKILSQFLYMLIPLYVNICWFILTKSLK